MTFSLLLVNITFLLLVNITLSQYLCTTANFGLKMAFSVEKSLTIIIITTLNIVVRIRKILSTLLS